MDEDQLLGDLTICCSSLANRASNFVPPSGPVGDLVIAVQGDVAEIGELSPSVRVVQVPGRGVAKSRNAALDSTNTRFLLFTDDDVQVSLEGVARAIERLRGSGAAIALGVGVDPSGKARKVRPDVTTKLTVFNSARAATYEMLVDIDQVRAAGVRFDERFGAGAEYYLGDEYIFISDLLRSGRRGLLVPDVFGVHPEVSSGSRWGEPEDARARALVFNRVFGVWALPVRAAFALRRHRDFKSWRRALSFVLDFSRP